MLKTLTVTALTALLVGTAAPIQAAGYPWSYHDAPFDFLFENHIDTHQQSKVNGATGKLRGLFYIVYTGEFVDGYPKATHGNCNERPNECTVGWTLDGVALTATYLGHAEGQHPLWCVDAQDLPAQRGYSHFHWLNVSEHPDGLTIGQQYAGYLMKLTATDQFFFEHHGGYFIDPGIDEESHANITTDCAPGGGGGGHDG